MTALPDFTQDISTVKQSIEQYIETMTANHVVDNQRVPIDKKVPNLKTEESFYVENSFDYEKIKEVNPLMIHPDHIEYMRETKQLIYDYLQ